MKVTIDLAHQEFFKKNGYIKFEELFTQEQIENVKKEIPDGEFDLWRSNPNLIKVLNQRKIAGLASELAKYTPLRLGYDWTITPPLSNMTNESLNEISSIQGIVCGLLICLADGENESEILPTKAGDGIYFQSDFNFPWDQLDLHQTYLLIVYTQERALFIRQPKDPHQKIYKDFGYAYGDRLKDQTHPIVYR